MIIINNNSNTSNIKNKINNNSYNFKYCSRYFHILLRKLKKIYTNNTSKQCIKIMLGVGTY